MTKPKERSALLDCIRFLAILIVIVYHAIDVYPDKSFSALADLIHRIGPYSVDMFFPLSGYLIARFLLKNTGKNAIRTFFLRRVFRILPLYIVAVTMFMLAMVLVGYETELLNRIWIPYFFLTAWFIALDGSGAVPYTITWTLSVEEFSYISFGVMALFSRRFFPLYLVLCVVLPSLLRWYMAAEVLPGYWYLPLTRIDSIAYGGLVAWILMHRTPMQTVLGLAAALVAMIVASRFDPSLAKSLGMNYVPVATCIFIVIFDFWMRRVSNPLIDAAANVGFYSYFLYLFHYFNIHGLNILFTKLNLPYPNLWVFAALAIVLTYVQAVISYRLFEGPMIRYGRTFEISEKNAKTSARTAP